MDTYRYRASERRTNGRQAAGRDGIMNEEKREGRKAGWQDGSKGGKEGKNGRRQEVKKARRQKDRKAEEGREG
jgi:hypothetical protein